MSVVHCIVLAIIAFAATFHLHWAFGGKIGFAVSLPQQPDGRPVMNHRLSWWRPAAFGVALALVLLAVVTLSVAGRMDLPFSMDVQRLILVFAGTAFVARAVVPNRYVGLLKTLRTTRWARYDTRLYSPLFLILGVSLLFLASR
jgi:hypothetical protein